MLFNYMGYRFKASSRRQKIEDELSLYQSGLHFLVHTLSQMGAVKTTCDHSYICFHLNQKVFLVIKNNSVDISLPKCSKFLGLQDKCVVSDGPTNSADDVPWHPIVG